jgi:hypothetical protein
VPRLIARPTLFRGFHLDQYIAGVKHLLRNDPLAATHFHDFLSRNENVMDLSFEIERYDATPQALRDLALKSRIRMNNVPKLGHELCASSDSEVTEDPVQPPAQKRIHNAQVKTEEENRHNYDDSSANDFLTVGPGNLLHFTPDVGVKLLCVLRPTFN